MQRRGGRRTWTHGPTLALTPFALHFAFPSLPPLSEQAEHPAFCPDHPKPRPLGYPLMPSLLSPDSSLGPTETPYIYLCPPFSLALCSSVSRRPSSILSLSPWQLPSVSLRSTKRQVASRCRWVNTGGVWAIFGRGGRKEWSYSESGSTSVLPFPIHPLTSSATLQPTYLPTYPVRRCGRSDTTVQSFWSETSRNIMPPLVHARTSPPVQ